MVNPVIKKSVASGFCILLMVVSLGCGGRQSLFENQPSISQAEFHPKYICGDEPIVTFSWAGRNFDRLEIHKATGGALLVLQSQQGKVTTPPITPEMLPLQATAFLRKESVPHPLLLINIDKPIWTMPYPSATENGSELESKFSRVEQEKQEDGTYKTVQIHDLFQEFDSFTWQIPGNDFSQKAVLEKIRNASDYPLIISGHGIAGEKTIDPNAIINVQKSTQPAGEWVLKLPRPQRRKVGERQGESEAGVTITDIPRTAYLQFYIRNREKASN